MSFVRLIGWFISVFSQSLSIYCSLIHTAWSTCNENFTCVFDWRREERMYILSLTDEVRISLYSAFWNDSVLSYFHSSELVPLERLFFPLFFDIKVLLSTFTWDDIQGDSGGICNTLGNDSMCDSKQKSSYEHVSDFERLPRYGKRYGLSCEHEQQLRNK